MLYNIIDDLTTDRCDTECSQSIVDCIESNTVNKCQIVDKDFTDKHTSSFPNGLTAHIDYSNGFDNSKVHCDAAIPDKTVGFLNHTVVEFSFTDPDRPPVDITSVDQCFHIAEIIAGTGCPNYAQARIQLISGLNIQEWEKELVDYPDKMLIEYLKFGFPYHYLLIAFTTLIKNHHSALQYLSAVNDYLRKEMALGAIVDPVAKICSDVYHCSPLLSRPKDNDKKRIILNLSHPHGNSVNDNVPRDKFHGQKFTLKFPPIDDIVGKIVDLKDQDPVLYKTDVARTFRNIGVYPVDTVKLGIYWQGEYFLDLRMVFGWVHGSATFQRLSDAIVYMRWKDYNLVAYIDNYVGIAQAKDAQS